MSQWFDFSYNANKLRQSYVKGFLDVSGGGVYVRSDNSLNFYTTNDGVVPKFSLDATQYRVYGKDRASDVALDYHDISVSTLAFLKDLSDNAQDQLDILFDRTQYIRSDTSENNTIFEMNGSDVNNKHVVLHGNLVPGIGETYDLGTSDKPFRSLYLKNNTIYFDTAADAFPSSAMSFNTDTGTMDISFNGKTGVSVLSYDGQVGIGIDDPRSPTAALDLSGQVLINAAGKSLVVETGDVSMNNGLVVGGAATLDSTLSVAKAATLSSTLVVDGDASLNSAFNLAGAATLESTLSVGKAATLSSTLDVVSDASLGGVLKLAGDASLNSNLYVDNLTTLNGDVSMNSNLLLGGDLSMAGNLVIKGNLSVFQTRETETITTKINNYELIITEDISLNGSLFASGDVSLNNKLFVSGDASFNQKLDVGGVLTVQSDVSLNSKLYVTDDVSMDATLKVGEDLDLLGGFINQY